MAIRSGSYGAGGIAYAALAYIAWGLFPIYFHRLADIGPVEVVMHRTVWSLVFLLAVLTVLRRWAWLNFLITEDFLTTKSKYPLSDKSRRPTQIS